MCLCMFLCGGGETSGVSGGFGKRVMEAIALRNKQFFSLYKVDAQTWCNNSIVTLPCEGSGAALQ